MKPRSANVVSLLIIALSFSITALLLDMTGDDNV
jgi:hypothetical protein